MNEEKIKELFSDEAFVNSILELETPKEVQNAFAEKGVELSLDEINYIKNSLSGSESELSDDDLENVAGGVSKSSSSISLDPNIIAQLSELCPKNVDAASRRW